MISVYGDTGIYDESIYYNGPMQVAETGAAGTLLSGPARILNISLVATGAGDTFLQWNSEPILYAPHGLSVTLPFPPNTILDAGDSLILAAAGVAAVTYAYP
jgi:hypothetical protein